MKKLQTAHAVTMYAAFSFLIAILFLTNFFMMSYATLLNFTFGKNGLTQQTREAGNRTAAEIVGEGTTLLKNEENALPLKNNAKVTLLGKTAVDFIYGGAGSAEIVAKNVVTLKDALESEGININPTVWNAYQKLAGNYKGSVPPIVGPGYFSVNEIPINILQQSANFQSSIGAYNEYAIIVLGRNGGEGADLPNSYLYLTENEVKLLQYACDNFQKVIVLINANNTLQLTWLEDGSGKVVKENIDDKNNANNVTITSHATNGILSEIQRQKIKSAVWIGSTGIAGNAALAQVLSGKINPSGKLVDSWAYDVMSAPASNYIGRASYGFEDNTGSIMPEKYNTGMLSNYTVYAEGIYVGYKYYESRYEDSISNKNNATTVSVAGKQWAYNDKEYGVQYPFGYGLSYTDFQYAFVGEPSYNSNTMAVTQQIKVKNIGNVAGKAVVQLYMQAPEVASVNGKRAERAAIQLVGFEKTELIFPQKETTVTVSVDVKDMRYYDVQNGGGFKVDTGNYYFATGKDVHDALNNILKQKSTTSNKLIASPSNPVVNGGEVGDVSLVKTLNIAEKDVTSMQSRIAVGQDGQKITNKFTGNGSYADITNYQSDFQYPSRADWSKFAIDLTRKSEDKSGVNIQWSEEVKRRIAAEVKPEAAVDALLQELENKPEYQQPVLFRQKTSQKLLFALGNAGFTNTNRQDKKTVLLELAQAMSYEESTKLVRMGGYATVANNSIGLPETENKDGPSGFTDTLFNYVKQGTAFPAQIVVAATWNTKLAQKIGKQIAQESIELQITGWYAPGLNLHRSALCGRNFEYYSEDGVISAKMGVATVKPAIDAGVIIYLKHIAMNDNETNRLGLGVWANEQTMREVYYSPVEDVIVDAKCNAIMTSFTRQGTRWTGHSYAFMTEVLRHEWGFNGMAITDFAGNNVFEGYLNIVGGLLAGNDLWLNTVDVLYKEINQARWANNVIVQNALQKSVQNIIYTIGTSNAMSPSMGLVDQKTGKVIEYLRPWQIILLSGSIISIVASSIGVAYVTVRIVWNKRKFKKKNHIRRILRP